MENEKTKPSLSTEPYKGVRDFYPEDMAIQNYIFSHLRKTVEQFGYSEYGASILEPTELYNAKSGEEIVSEQTYSFKDRGDRDVTLRPEMTPTVTRMVAAKKRELAFPLRWYSIPNLFRYEKPQRGRLREHYQLNVDIFGADSIDADVEIVHIAYSVLKDLGAKDDWFPIRVNNRKILNYLLEQVFSLKEKDAYAVTKLIDKKKKIWPEEFKKNIEEYLKDKTDSFISILNSTTVDEFKSRVVQAASSEVLGVEEVQNLISKLNKLGVTNVVFDPTLARGFDYYTGIVFEVFDTSPENTRSLFGGGRFDDLLSIFGSDKVAAAGFGMGDVTIRDFLEVHQILPTLGSTTDVYICVIDEHARDSAATFANELREAGLNTAIDTTARKLAAQIQTADKQRIPFIIVLGEQEVKDKVYKVKELTSGKESEFKETALIAEFIHTSRKHASTRE